MTKNTAEALSAHTKPRNRLFHERCSCVTFTVFNIEYIHIIFLTYLSYQTMDSLLYLIKPVVHLWYLKKKTKLTHLFFAVEYNSMKTPLHLVQSVK